MFRLSRRRLITVTRIATGPVLDFTGGIGRLQYYGSTTFQGLLLPPQRRVTRTLSGIRLAVTWTLIPQGNPVVLEQDNLYFPGDTKAYVVTAIKKYPRHTEFNLELKQ